jgi:hypothetical protein
MKTFIYALCDPITEEIRYIGKTNTPRKRYYSHLNESKIGKRKSHKISWIRKLLSLNQKPVMKIIDEVDSAEWKFWEAHYINLYKCNGNLTNLTEGGQGGNGYSHTEESKQRMSKSKKGRKLSDDQKLKLSEGQKKKHAETPSYNRNGNNIKKNIDKDLSSRIIFSNIHNINLLPSVKHSARHLRCATYHSPAQLKLDEY